MTDLTHYATPEDIHSARPDIPIDSIRRHLRDGVIPGAVKVGRSWVVPTAAAETYVATYARYARTGPDAPPSDTSGPATPSKEQ